MTDFQIVDEKNYTIAKVTDRGELVTAPLKYSEAYYNQITVVDTPFEIVKGKAQHNFVITGLLISSDKSFASSTDGEPITIYEANPANLSTNNKTLFQLDLLKSDRLPITGLNLITNCAVSIVASAISVNVDVTLAGYYVDDIK